MNYKNFQESISHTTDGQPYALYHSVIPAGHVEALYLHMHPEFEIFYVTDGTLELEISSKCYTLTSGEAIFIPSGLMHRALCPDLQGAAFYAMVFSDTFLIPLTDTSRFRHYFPTEIYNSPDSILPFDHSVNWKSVSLKIMVQIFSRRNSDLKIQGYLMILWDILHQNYFSEFILANKKKGNIHLQNALRYIHEHYTEELSLNTISSIAHMSNAYFCRMFKKLTQYSPVQYINRYRIMQSCALLRDTDLNINEICYRCGYNNVSYFNREFRMVLNCSPKEYRKRL